MTIASLSVPVHDEVGESFERGAVGLAVEGRAGAGRVLEGEAAGGLDRAGGGHPLERAVDRLARERPPDAPRPRGRRGSAAASACRRAGRRRGPSRSCRSRPCSRGCRRRSGTRRRARGRRRRAPGAPPPRTQAASKSFPVLSEQRARYSSTVVSGRNACRRWSASPRASASAASASTATPWASPVPASSANARAKR